MRDRALAEVVAGLADAFAEVRRPVAIEACSCCRRDDKIAVLLEKPRDELTADDLWWYAFKSLSTVGDASDLRYFTPRLLELAVSDQPTIIDAEMVFGKLARADWQTWPEAPVLRELADALWHDVLTRTPPRFQAREVLDALRHVEADVTSRLDDWHPLATPVAIQQLHDLAADRLHGRTPPPDVDAWLNGPAHEAVKAAFDRATDEPTLALLTTLDDLLTWTTPSPHRSTPQQRPGRPPACA